MMFEEDKQISMSGVEKKTFIDLPKIPPKLFAFLMVDPLYVITSAC